MFGFFCVLLGPPDRWSKCFLASTLQVRFRRSPLPPLPENPRVVIPFECLVFFFSDSPLPSGCHLSRPPFLNAVQISSPSPLEKHAFFYDKAMRLVDSFLIGMTCADLFFLLYRIWFCLDLLMKQVGAVLFEFQFLFVQSSFPSSRDLSLSCVRMRSLFSFSSPDTPFFPLPPGRFFLCAPVPYVPIRIFPQFFRSSYGPQP